MFRTIDEFQQADLTALQAELQEREGALEDMTKLRIKISAEACLIRKKVEILESKQPSWDSSIYIKDDYSGVTYYPVVPSDAADIDRDRNVRIRTSHRDESKLDLSFRKGWQVVRAGGYDLSDFTMVAVKKDSEEFIQAIKDWIHKGELPVQVAEPVKVTVAETTPFVTPPPQPSEPDFAPQCKVAFIHCTTSESGYV